jgi:hypothetical protein
MGYTTEFEGQFEISPNLSLDHKEYLQAFSDTRRMKRDPVKAVLLPDPRRQSVNLPIGEESCYFVGGLGFAGQDMDESISSYNASPIGQPGLWCQWIPNEDGSAILWNGGEKFYNYVEWLSYIIDNFLIPWGYVLNGTVTWQGEDEEDRGIISVADNTVTVTEQTIDPVPEVEQLKSRKSELLAELKDIESRLEEFR